MNRKYDVIILGAGAAGLMCAMEAGKRRRRVLVLERADRIGKKILISGGGRSENDDIVFPIHAEMSLAGLERIQCRCIRQRQNVGAFGDDRDTGFARQSL